MHTYEKLWLFKEKIIFKIVNYLRSSALELWNWYKNSCQKSLSAAGMEVKCGGKTIDDQLQSVETSGCGIQVN